MIDLAQLEPERPRLIRRDEYDRMVEMGLFEDERVELIRGVIVAMSPAYPQHTSPVQDLNMLLVVALTGRAIVRIQHPLVAADESEPEPDVAVVPLGDYHEHHPDRAHLVIEVAYSSLRKDRALKAPLYAESGFHEYWLVNVVERVVEVYRGPTPTGWTHVTQHGRDETLHLVDFPDVAVRIADFVR